MTNMLSVNNKYLGLDGLRAISVLLVMCSHQGIFMNFPSIWAGKLIPIIGGIAGVNFFFIISGFLITNILYKQSQKKLNITLFMRDRALRLIPALFVYVLTIQCLSFLSLIDIKPEMLLFAFFYLYNFVSIGSEFYSPVLAHTWSLAVEQHFYIVFPFVIKYLRVTRLIIVLCLFCIGNAIGYCILHNINLSTYRWTIPACTPILVGALLAVLHRSNLIFKTKVKINFLLAAAVPLWLLPLYIPIYMQMYFYLPQIIGMGFIVYAIILGQKTKFVGFLECRPLNYLGMISYGLYLWQGLFITNGPGNQYYWVQKFPQNFLLTFIVSVISWYLIEFPFLKLKKRLSNWGEPRKKWAFNA